MKKILKKETSIKSEKIIICVLVNKIDDRLLTGRNPPDEMIDNAKFRELYDRNPNKFKIIKIETVNAVYSKNILTVCLRISVLLKDIKFVSVFFKLSS